MRRLRVNPNAPESGAIGAATQQILAGGVVVIPTDTLYGLAADPRQPEAVQRVFAIKGRDGRPLPLIAGDHAQVVTATGTLSAQAERLASRFWPGPLTLLVPAPAGIAADVSAGTGRVGVRVPDNLVATALCLSVGSLLTATSANLSGEPPSAEPDAVADGLGTKENDIDVFLDAGRTPGGLPSTVVDVTGAEPRLVRAGAIPWEAVRRALSEVYE